jgi:hypothetical protein
MALFGSVIIYSEGMPMMASRKYNACYAANGFAK